MNDFSAEQKRYLEGFVSGVQARARRRRGSRRSAAARGVAGPRAARGSGRDPPQGAGRDGRRPARSSPTRRNGSARNTRSTPMPGSRSRPRRTSFPSRADNFRWRYHGLFYVAPAQNSYMCRLRIPNGILKAWQFDGRGRPRRAARRRLRACHHPRQSPDPRDRGAERGGAGRGPAGSRPVLAQGSGADNIRNVTGDATAGIDPQELLDTRPYAQGVAPPHPQRPRALRPAAQVQRRFRRRRRSCRRWRTPTTSASRPSR